MSFDLALRLSEIAVAFALLQRALEHLHQPDRRAFVPQIPLALLLGAGVAPGIVLPLLWVALCAQLWRFQGPYNGGSDKMLMLVVTCLALARLAPSAQIAELALAYLAAQLVLSYVVSGWIKVINPDWRRGAALARVFACSAYPVSQSLQRWGAHPRAMRGLSWAVIGFELAFPLALLTGQTTILALAAAFVFHLCNACLLGLNRFVWAWVSAFPALVWCQGRLISGVVA